MSLYLMSGSLETASEEALRCKWFSGESCDDQNLPGMKEPSRVESRKMSCKALSTKASASSGDPGAGVAQDFSCLETSVCMGGGRGVVYIPLLSLSGRWMWAVPG